MTTAETLVVAALVLGEGPIPYRDGFVCVDIRRGTVLEGDLTGALTPIAEFDTTVGAVAESDDGSLLVCAGTEVRTLAGDRSIQLLDQDGDIRLNDGKPDPAGRLVVGTMADPPRPGVAGLWTFDGGSAAPLLDSLTISNGLCWSADGATMFHVDTPTRQIVAFDYDIDSGAIGGRRTIVTIDDELGAPDGMTIDIEGGLWIALWGGGAVHRYSPIGELDEVIEVPTPFVTCPVFVGDDWSTLLITTASEPDPGDPGAGDLYIARPGVRGRPPRRASIDRVFGPEPS